MVILENIRLLYDGKTGTSASVYKNMDLLIEQARITAIRPHSPDLDVGATRVDCSSYTVTPGLIDCHGHITVLGLSARDTEIMSGFEQMVYVEKILYLSLVKGGVTTMRDVGGATNLMKRLVENGVIIGPRLKIAICMLSTTGGHADFRGPDRCHAEMQKMWGPIPGRPSMIVDGPWECRKRVREIVACGADLIKICTSGGVASPTDTLDNPEFTEQEMQALCSEAAAHGLRVAAHSHSRSGIELAIKSGVNDIQHVSFIDKNLIEAAHEKGCTITPTSWVMQLLPDSPGLSPFVREKAKRAAEAHVNAVQFARAGGIKILAGSDPVLPHMHGRNYMEMVALVSDGLKPLEAWHSMTGLAAQIIELDDTGTIEVGKRADLLISSQDVIHQPESLDNGALLEVIKDGTAYRGHIKELPQKDFSSTTNNLWKSEQY